MSFKSVFDFERTIAEFFGSTYAVATDSCTHAIELCLRLKNKKLATCPRHTYISIPFTFKKLNIDWYFTDEKWRDFYYIDNSIIDAAVYWCRNGFISDTYMCLSFQYQKHLSLGRGGAILLDSFDDYLNLKKMSYDGRIPDVPWADQNIDKIGYHYYMTPETATTGLKKFPIACETKPKLWSFKDYPDLSKMKVFRNL